MGPMHLLLQEPQWSGSLLRSTLHPCAAIPSQFAVLGGHGTPLEELLLLGPPLLCPLLLCPPLLVGPLLLVGPPLALEALLAPSPPAPPASAGLSES